MKFEFTEYKDLATGATIDCNLTIETNDEAYPGTGSFRGMSIGPRWEMNTEVDGQIYYILWLQDEGEELIDADLVDWEHPNILIKGC